MQEGEQQKYVCYGTGVGRFHGGHADDQLQWYNVYIDGIFLCSDLKHGRVFLVRTYESSPPDLDHDRTISRLRPRVHYGLITKMSLVPM